MSLRRGAERKAEGVSAERLKAQRTLPTLAYTGRYTSSMSKTVPVREFRTHLADLLDEVADRREHVTITRHGRPAAVLVPVDEYEALEETAEILSDEEALAAIRRGLGDLATGDVISLDEVRAEHAARDRS
jgi:antitoxin YefM